MGGAAAEGYGACTKGGAEGVWCVGGWVRVKTVIDVVNLLALVHPDELADVLNPDT